MCIPTKNIWYQILWIKPKLLYLLKKIQATQTRLLKLLFRKGYRRVQPKRFLNLNYKSASKYIIAF